MFNYTDMILSVMQRVEVYNEIFNAISKEVQENSYSQGPNRRGKDTYVFCRNNVSRFFVEEANFRRNLSVYEEKEATQILLQGLDTYKEGVYYWLDALDEKCEVMDEIKYKRGLLGKETSFELINQACKQACEGIESAHSVHKM